MVDFPSRGQKAPAYWDTQLKTYIDEGVDGAVTPEKVAATLDQEPMASDLSASIDGRTRTGKRPVGRDELMFSVLDYGAVGDGATDDLTAINATYAAAAAVLGSVFFPPNKTYIVSGAITSTNGTKTYGYGATVKIKNGTTPTWALYNPTGSLGFHMFGLTIDLNKANTTDPGADTQGVAIYVQPNGTDWGGMVLRDVTVLNGHQYGVRMTGPTLTDALNASSTPAQITNCVVSGCGRGFYAQRVGDVGFVGCVSTGATSTGSGDGFSADRSRNIRFASCIAKSNARHGFVSQYCYGTVVTGCTAASNTNVGIVVGGGSTTFVEDRCASITGNTCRGNLNGIQIDTRKTSGYTTINAYAAVVGNTCDSNARVAGVGGFGILVSTTGRVTVSGNTCTGNYMGININDAQYNAITGNVVANNTDRGIHFTQVNGTCSDNTLDGNDSRDNPTANYSYNAGCVRSAYRIRGSAAPAGSVYAIPGCEVVNEAPAVGSPKSWVCTVAGAPGTWVSTGNL